MTKDFLNCILLASAFLCLPAGMLAQDRFDPEYDNRANLQDFRNAQTLFHELRSDLQRAEGAQTAGTHSFAPARAELAELQREWDENEYDRHHAEALITALQTILGENHLLARDRDKLTKDLKRMRDFLTAHY